MNSNGVSMPSTLEGVLVALTVALGSGEPGLDQDAAAVATEARPTPPAACAQYVESEARRNCLARVSRPAVAEAAFPTELRWVAPSDPGMATWLRLPNALR
jgi:hypothetical protein